jgi:drug/metabolite transporter (DMT)-like permease
MLLGGIFLLAWLALTKRSSFKLQRKQLISIFFLAVFSIYLTNILEFWGLQYLSSAKTCFIYSLSPFFAALFSYLHFKEKMNVRKWIGMGVGFLGFIPVIMTQTGSEDLLRVGSFFTLPTLAIAGAALFSVYGWVLLRLTVKDQELSPVMANGSSMLLGGLLALGHSFFVEAWHPIPVDGAHISPFLQNLFFMTILYNVICYNLYGAMLKRFTATFLSFVGLLSPVFASISGWLFLNEPISPVILLSTGVVSIGLGIVYYAELKQGYILKKAKAENPEN